MRTAAAVGGLIGQLFLSDGRLIASAISTASTRGTSATVTLLAGGAGAVAAGPCPPCDRNASRNRKAGEREQPGLPRGPLASGKREDNEAVRGLLPAPAPPPVPEEAGGREGAVSRGRSRGGERGISTVSGTGMVSDVEEQGGDAVGNRRSVAARAASAPAAAAAGIATAGGGGELLSPEESRFSSDRAATEAAVRATASLVEDAQGAARWGDRRLDGRPRGREQEAEHHRHARLRGLRGSSPPATPPPPPPPQPPSILSYGVFGASVQAESDGRRTVRGLTEGVREEGGTGDGQSVGAGTESHDSEGIEILEVSRTGIGVLDPDASTASALGAEKGFVNREAGTVEAAGVGMGREQHQQLELSRSSRTLADGLGAFPDGAKPECELTVPDYAFEGGGPAVFQPLEGDVLLLGSEATVTWSLNLFEESVVTTGDSAGTTITTTSATDLDVQEVNVTLFDGDSEVRTFLDIDNSGNFSWTLSDLEQSPTYQLAVWNFATGICGISHAFGISTSLSITVTEFHGFNEGTVDISPLRKGENTSWEAGEEVYSCGGSVGVGWNFTGLLEEVDVRICQEPSSSGSLAGLEDEDLQDSGAPLTDDGDFFVCFDPVSNSVLANSSFLTASLTADASTSPRVDTCGVWGEGFYAKVTWVDNGDSEVFGLSNDGEAGGTTVPVLGGVFVVPDGSISVSISESQVISWEGRTGGGDNAEVDIILRSTRSDDVYYVVAKGDVRTSTDGEFTWEEPWTAFTEEELSSEDMFQERFYLELFDAIGGGLICKSMEFMLEADDASNQSNASTLLLLLTPAALLLLCCCGVFFVACPYYDKIVRRRRDELRPSLIDVDDTYIIDGEGQPAILALDSHVIPLAHAQFWPADGTSSLNARHSGSFFPRRVPSDNGRGGGDVGVTNSSSWAQAMLAMGLGVTESISRAAGLTVNSEGTTSSTGGNGRGAENGGHEEGGSGLDDACSGVAAVVGRGASVAGSVERASSVSSWRGMRSGATWAFGNGGSIGRRSGGRRDGGGVYPTAAAALGLGLAPYHDIEEKTEAAATTGGASVGSGGGQGDSSAASTSSNNNKSLDACFAVGGRRHSGGNTAAVDDNNNNVPSTSWYSRPSSVDLATLLGRTEYSNSCSNRHNGSGDGGGGLQEGAIAGGGVGPGRSRSGTGTLARLLGGGGSGHSGNLDREREREKVAVMESEVEADQVEIVEVARAVVVDENGVELPSMTTAVVGLEVMDCFSDHEYLDGTDTTSPADRCTLMRSGRAGEGGFIP